MWLVLSKEGGGGYLCLSQFALCFGLFICVSEESLFNAKLPTRHAREVPVMINFLIMGINLCCRSLGIWLYHTNRTHFIHAMFRVNRYD